MFKRISAARAAVAGAVLAAAAATLVVLTGCDALSAAAGVEKADQRSRCSIMCPPMVRPRE